VFRPTHRVCNDTMENVMFQGVSTNSLSSVVINSCRFYCIQKHTQHMKNPIRQYLPDTSLPSLALQNRKLNVTRKYCEGRRHMNRLDSRGTVWAGHSFYSSLLLLPFPSLVLPCFLVLDTFPNSVMSFRRHSFLLHQQLSFALPLFLASSAPP
jgi:hypothetical protein